MFIKYNSQILEFKDTLNWSAFKRYTKICVRKQSVKNVT